MSYVDSLGKCCWYDFHTWVAHTDDLSILTTIAEYYPCMSCRKHFNEMLQNEPQGVDETAEIYLFRLHNIVNTNKGKRKASESVLTQYTSPEAREHFYKHLYNVNWVERLEYHHQHCLDNKLRVGSLF
jgi:hypothetical protein